MAQWVKIELNGDVKRGGEMAQWVKSACGTSLRA